MYNHFQLHPWIKIIKNQSNKGETERTEDNNKLTDKLEDAIQQEAVVELSETGDTDEPPTPPRVTRCPTQRMLDDARLELEEILSTMNNKSSGGIEDVTE